MNTTTIPGLHHVTAIAGGAQINVDFYTRVLGLRLVKQTVNFDDPGTYHLYYGDRNGTPGSILTFFPFAGALPGRSGSGMSGETSFTVSPSALEDWVQRFADVRGSGEYRLFDFDAVQDRFGDPVLRFKDPDGLPLAFVGRSDVEAPFGSFDGVTLNSRNPDATARVLTDLFGYTFDANERGRSRFLADTSAPAHRIDIISENDLGRPGAGTVHHVAFRARSDEEQVEWQQRVSDAGLPVTEVKDRQYFHSIYFREPGGILFEIATDPPGFTVDEPLESLGKALKLPQWFEPRREDIARRLPELRLEKAGEWQ